MKIVWNTLAIDIELVPILKHPTSLLSSCPPPPFPFIHEFYLALQAEMRGGGGEEKTRVNLAGISHHVASSLQA
jgi:hypothetical protein